MEQQVFCVSFRNNNCDGNFVFEVSRKTKSDTHIIRHTHTYIHKIRHT